MRESGIRIVTAAALLMISTGCVERSLTIRTQPEDALVYMNEHFKGRSPLTYDFQWYGWYRVRIEKEGYVRLNDHKQLKAPLHFWIPLDLVMELLPWTVRDDREWSYTLEPEQVISAPKRPSEPRWSDTVIPEEQEAQEVQEGIAEEEAAEREGAEEAVLESAEEREE